MHPPTEIRKQEITHYVICMLPCKFGILFCFLHLCDKDFLNTHGIIFVYFHIHIGNT